MNQSNQMTITRALNELNLLDKRISKKIQEGCFINYRIGEGDPEIPNCDPESSLQSIQDLIERRRKIKSSILRSNSSTTVMVNDEEMTVAEAIERKASIHYEKELLETMRISLRSIANKVEEHNEGRYRTLAHLLESNFSKEGKIRTEETKAIEEQFWKSNRAEFIDNIELSNKIKELDEYIDSFENEVDLVLNESNAITYIEV